MATGFPVKANYATGDVLTATNMNDLSGTVNYLQYMPPRNPIINSNMSVWQRGTSFAVGTGNVYTADRWQASRGSLVAGCTVSRQSSGLTGIQYAARIQRDSGNTATNSLNFWYNLETADSYRFAGQTVTLSVYVKVGANYSPAGGALNIQLYSGTGTDQNVNVAGFTNSTVVASSTITPTTSYVRYTLTGTVAANATQLAVLFYNNPTGTAGANDWYEVTGVQLELGSVANTYMPNQPTYQGELAACQRYYYRVTGYTLAPSAFAFNTIEADCALQLPVTMRTTPTTLDWSGVTFRNYAGSNYAITAATLTLYAPLTNSQIAYIYGSITGATAGNVGTLIGTTTSGYIGIGAEL